MTHFNPPPGWPTPPEGWEPPPGWQPDPSWPPAPAGWDFGSAWSAAIQTWPAAQQRSHKELAQEEKAQAKAQAAFRASPVGRAISAKEEGLGFFEIQLSVTRSRRDSTWWGANNTTLQKYHKVQSHTDVLTAIEQVGWRLEHASYVFMATSESSRDKFLSSGQQTAISGEIVGIYLFRSADSPAL